MRSIAFPMELYLAGALIVGATTLPQISDHPASLPSESTIPSAVPGFDRSPTMHGTLRPISPDDVQLHSVGVETIDWERRLHVDPNVTPASQFRLVDHLNSPRKTEPSADRQPDSLTTVNALIEKPVTGTFDGSQPIVGSAKSGCSSVDCSRRTLLRNIRRRK